MTRAPGVDLFARYAEPPRARGFCGPAGTGDLTHADEATVRAAARRFSGVWPYLRILADLTGVADPLDPRLVESYWLGGGVGGAVDQDTFARRLVAELARGAGGHWPHLDPELAPGLAPEITPDHLAHVFAVYPWSRLLGDPADPATRAALEVLDRCRVRPGLVLTVHDDGLRVLSVPLCWDGDRLDLDRPTVETVHDAGTGARPGDAVALHWDRCCAVISTERAGALVEATRRRLAVTSARSARAAG